MGKDLFDLESGGFTDDYSATITDVQFNDSEYGWQATIVNKLDDPVPTATGELITERKVFVKLPGGWASPDAGETILHESGDLDKRPRVDSAYGALMERVKELGAAPQMVKQAERGPYAVAGWLGLRFHWMTEGQGDSYTMPATTDSLTWMQKRIDNGEGTATREGVRVDAIRADDLFKGKKKGKPMPVEYLGTKDAPQTGTVGAATSNGAGFVAGDLGLPDDILDALIGLAETHTKEKFVDEALRFASQEGVDQGPFVASLSSGDLYEALRVG